jgi:hypothetical protein
VRSVCLTIENKSSTSKIGSKWEVKSSFCFLEKDHDCRYLTPSLYSKHTLGVLNKMPWAAKIKLEKEGLRELISNLPSSTDIFKPMIF